MKQRKALFLDTYIKLNQPKEAVAAAKVILADDPKDFTSLYYTMYLRARWRATIQHPTSWIKAKKPRPRLWRTSTHLHRM